MWQYLIWRYYKIEYLEKEAKQEYLQIKYIHHISDMSQDHPYQVSDGLGIDKKTMFRLLAELDILASMINFY